MDELTNADASDRVRESVAYALRVLGPPEDVVQEPDASSAAVG